MGLFDLSPEKIMAALGIDPAQLLAQVEGFKAGMGQTIQHFDARMVEILANQQRIEHKLDLLLQQRIARTDKDASHE
jgi:hypothetical protein